jgi:trehalose 6-phosphate phosphatase
MVHILSRRHVSRLAEFAASNVLLAFDYDGTLAPIAPDPEFAPMRPRTRRLLRTVARRYPCVVISGRARADLARCVDGVPVWHLSGNHGLEPWGEDAAYPAQVKSWVRQLEQRLAGHHGVVVENKAYSLTIHYRHARPKRAALRAVDRAVRTLRGARTIPGKEAISVVPRGAVDKGDALERARRLLHCDRAIYVGDDDTDEDAFDPARPERLLGIRVGLRHRSRARYHLKNQGEIDRLLETLIALRPIRRTER